MPQDLATRTHAATTGTQPARAWGGVSHVCRRALPGVFPWHLRAGGGGAPGGNRQSRPLGTPAIRSVRRREACATRGGRGMQASVGRQCPTDNAARGVAVAGFGRRSGVSSRPTLRRTNRSKQ